MTFKPPPIPKLTLLQAYRMRLKRRRILWRSFRSRHDLTLCANRTAGVRADAILLFLVIRNEFERLPHFLQHYRSLGVDHFLVVDNGSGDGGKEFLLTQPDCSVWSTSASYKAARFGMDWLAWLLMKFGHGHWCLTVDADELLVYANWPNRDLRQVTADLEATGRTAMGAVMLEPYPKGALGQQTYVPGQSPLDILTWIDPPDLRSQRQAPGLNLWVQGGVRERVFFPDQPARSPTLNKLPLVKWNRRNVYVNSTHAMLPPKANLAYDGPGDPRPSGVLLHTKFLPSIVERSETEKARRQHFGASEDFDRYYDALAAGPVLWTKEALAYAGWEQLVELGFMSSIPGKPQNNSR